MSKLNQSAVSKDQRRRRARDRDLQSVRDGRTDDDDGRSDMGALASRLCGWCDDESAGDNGKAGAAPPAPSFEAEGGEGRVKDVSEALEREIDCDYLVVGAGACSLSFVDTLLAEMPGLRIAIVDKHDAPGGHWNDAYDFVRLHQPSLFYGLASRQLEGSWLWLLLRGMMPFHHRAGKHEILGMFKAAVRAWVRAGKVRYYPSCAFDFAHAKKHPNGPHRFTILDGTAEYAATVAMKVVDGTLGEPLVPSTQPLPFPVDKGIDVLTPNDLPHLRKKHSHYVVLGCGKTGMDSCVYLQRKMGVDPKDISLVIPNGEQPSRSLDRSIALAKTIRDSTDADSRARLLLLLLSRRHLDVQPVPPRVLEERGSVRLLAQVSRI